MPIEETWGERWFVVSRIRKHGCHRDLPHAALRTTWMACSNRGLDPLLGSPAQSAWLSPKNLHSWQCPQVRLTLLISNRWHFGNHCHIICLFPGKNNVPDSHRTHEPPPWVPLLRCHLELQPLPPPPAHTWHSQSRYGCHSRTREKGAWERDSQQTSSAFLIDIYLPGISALNRKSGPGNIKEMHF